jgi:glycyl-tRNA synthetase (class II)
VVGFDLAKAKQLAELTVNAQSNEAAKKTLEGLSYDVYVAQASLPAEQRIAKYQAAIDANNANALETEQREQAIYAATTIDQVYAIVYPPAAS